MAALPKGSPEFLAKVAEMKAVSAQVKEQRGAAEGDRGDAFARPCSPCPTCPTRACRTARGPADNVVHATHGDPARRVRRTPCPTGRSPASSGSSTFARGAKVTGAGFPFYVGDAARLVRALLRFFLEENGAGRLRAR